MRQCIDAPRRHDANDRRLVEILNLVRESFAYMDGRIDPPSSVHRLTIEDIAAACADGEAWSIGDPPMGCIFLQPMKDRLYLGKLAVSPAQKGQGRGTCLVRLAEGRARALGLPVLELRTRIELIENHLIFEKMGFLKCEEASHPDYDRPTYIVMRKPVSMSSLS